MCAVRQSQRQQPSLRLGPWYKRQQTELCKKIRHEVNLRVVS
eukprot:COSAG06_NODE_44209_length_365_cov_0.973684_1_plen_41_part_10